MKKTPRAVVDEMFAAFEAGDIDGVVATVSDDTLWIYHGTQVIPPNEFRNKERVRKFFTSIFRGTDVLKFEREQYIEQDNVVVVLGNEHQRVKKSGKELKQKWVQIYTVENELITHMEEFATSEVVKP